VECISCQQHIRIADLPLRDRIQLTRHWRLAHAWGSLPGWLVVVLRRHVVEVAELTVEEAAELGMMLRQASAALEAVVGCSKTYIALFGEQEGFEHLHVHVVPRMPDFGEGHLGTRVFEFLKCPASEWVSADARDALALALAEKLDPFPDR